MQGQRKIRIAVVFGGRSTEHAVSCASASLVLSAIDRERYEVLPIGITRDGRWVLTSGDPGRIGAASPGALPSVEAVATKPGTSIAPLPGGSLQVVSPDEVPRSLGEVDVVLPLLHGAYGEDGTLQGLLELTGTRYAGAGVLASAAGMDKEYMKLILAAHGLPLGRYVVIKDRDWRSGSHERKRLLDEIAELGWPVFVKPARGGSSIGITRVTALADLEPAIDAAREYDPKVLVEAAVDGIEVECAVLEGIDGGPPEASLPGQVLVDERSSFYDFEAKYMASGDTMRIPAPIPATATAEVRRLACAAFDAISCEGLARVDFFYTPDGKIVVNEINTMPGMTAASGFPMMWAATGMAMPELIERIITTALAKRPGLRLVGGCEVGVGVLPFCLGWFAFAGLPGEACAWDHDNLYLVGCGNMPTIGTSNPSLTMTARLPFASLPGEACAGGFAFAGLPFAVTCPEQPDTPDGGIGGCGPPMPPSVSLSLRRFGLLFLGRGLAAIDQRLEVRAGAELRHRGRWHVDGGSGGRVTGGASGALALLKDAETGDGHLVAGRHGRLNGLEYRVHGFGRRLLVPQPSRDRVDQITLVHSSLLRFPHGRSRGLRFRGSRPLTCPKVGDPAPLHNNHGQIRRRVGPNRRWWHRFRNPAGSRHHVPYENRVSWHFPTAAEDRRLHPAHKPIRVLPYAPSAAPATSPTPR